MTSIDCCRTRSVLEKKPGDQRRALVFQGRLGRLKSAASCAAVIAHKCIGAVVIAAIPSVAAGHVALPAIATAHAVIAARFYIDAFAIDHPGPVAITIVAPIAIVTAIAVIAPITVVSAIDAADDQSTADGSNSQSCSEIPASSGLRWCGNGARNDRRGDNCGNGPNGNPFHGKSRPSSLKLAKSRPLPAVSAKAGLGTTA